MHKTIFIYITNLFELLAAITGIFYYTKLKSSYWKWFTWFLVFTFVTEMIAKYITYKYGSGKNSWLYYYINLPVTFSFFIWLFYKWLPPGLLKKWALAGLVIYLATCVFEIGFYGNSKMFNAALAYEVAMIVLLLLAIMYYAAVIKSPDGIYYYRDSMFWFVTGMIVYYLCNLPLYVYRSDIFKLNENFGKIYWQSCQVLNYLMYLSFIISIKWGKPNHSYSALYSQQSPSSSL